MLLQLALQGAYGHLKLLNQMGLLEFPLDYDKKVDLNEWIMSNLIEYLNLYCSFERGRRLIFKIFEKNKESFFWKGL